MILTLGISGRLRQGHLFRVGSGLGVGTALNESHSMGGYGSKGWGGDTDPGEKCDEDCMDCENDVLECS